ncbi:helix-turn-helix domain-containing protein [Dactylosporangium aurantiacum]|uniref:Helix-turn-helix domain-containing protein n=1 Tax=Dactylosporangium aurantiacum TaxID=35754 RepID=A0A9Q9IN83_9ACTN|nr:helix-turn-helix domain-containing protein [Dactylosporangium aurantiacum]MDG6104533.1 helix-turn-helix domain-containing protein [Dactylosporangium aurantiacum]UWZ56145.1 helix-turn-helix domain-containing protein [Dactylosporangium aurantiacum]
MDAAAIAALAEPQRRAVYEHVAAAGVPVSRNAVADALGIGRTLAAHHLDRLAEAGLLEVSFARVNGRSGPGSGRPSKLYRRTGTEHELSLPPRDYRTLATVFADAVEEAGVEPVLFEAARRQGARLRRDDAPVDELLRGMGYEPYEDGPVWRLRNCPFDGVARTHAALVCGANLALLEGALGARVEIDPRPEGCCVTVRRTKDNDDVF